MAKSNTAKIISTIDHVSPFISKTLNPCRAQLELVISKATIYFMIKY